MKRTDYIVNESVKRVVEQYNEVDRLLMNARHAACDLMMEHDLLPHTGKNKAVTICRRRQREDLRKICEDIARMRDRLTEIASDIEELHDADA